MLPTSPQDFGTPLLLEDYTAITQPANAASPPLCTTCHSPSTPRRCSTCKPVHYCSRACQTHDWPLHKQLCRASTAHTHDTKAPTASHRRALYLPPSRPKPAFAWLRYGTDGAPLDMDRFFPGAPAGARRTIAFHDRFVPFWIQISYDGNAGGRALGLNACVAQLLGLAAGGEETDRIGAWRGPLVVLAYSAEEGLGAPALDVGPAVLGPVVRYLGLRREYAGPVFVEQPQERYGEEEWERLSGGGGE